MSKIQWKTKEEIEEGKSKIPTVGELQAKIEQMEEERKISDLAILELTEMMIGGEGRLKLIC